MRHQIFANASHPVLKTLVKDKSRILKTESQIQNHESKQWNKYPTPKWNAEEQKSVDSEIITDLNKEMAQHNAANSHLHQSSQASLKPQIGLISNKKLPSQENSQLQKSQVNIQQSQIQAQSQLLAPKQVPIQEPQIVNKNKQIMLQGYQTEQIDQNIKNISQMERPKSYSSQTNNLKSGFINLRLQPQENTRQPRQLDEIEQTPRTQLNQEQEQRIKNELNKLKLQDEKRRHLLTPSPSVSQQHTPERDIKYNKSFMSTKSRDERSPNIREIHSYYNEVIDWCEYLESELKNQSKLNNCQFNYLENKLRLLTKELRSTQEFMIDRI